MTSTKRQRIANRALKALIDLPDDHPSRTKPEGGGKSEWGWAYGYLTAERAAAYGSWTHLPNVGPETPGDDLARKLLREVSQR